MSYINEKRKQKIVHYNFMIEKIKKQMEEINNKLTTINEEEAQFRMQEKNVNVVAEYDEIWKTLNNLKVAYERCPKNLPANSEVSKSLYEKQYGDADFCRQLFLKKHPEFVQFDENKAIRKDLSAQLSLLEGELKHYKMKVDILLSKMNKKDDELTF